MISESSLHYCDVNLVSMEHEYNGPKSTLVRIIDRCIPRRRATYATQPSLDVPQQWQVVKVLIWHRAASPTRMNHLIVFARWRQRASPSNTWFSRPTRIYLRIRVCNWEKKISTGLMLKRYRFITPDKKRIIRIFLRVHWFTKRF